jgi:hypothetical protein
MPIQTKPISNGDYKVTRDLAPGAAALLCSNTRLVKENVNFTLTLRLFALHYRW